MSNDMKLIMENWRASVLNESQADKVAKKLLDNFEDFVDDIEILPRLALKALSTAFNSISSPFSVDVP